MPRKVRRLAFAERGERAVELLTGESRTGSLRVPAGEVRVVAEPLA